MRQGRKPPPCCRKARISNAVSRQKGKQISSRDSWDINIIAQEGREFKHKTGRADFDSACFPYSLLYRSFISVRGKLLYEYRLNGRLFSINSFSILDQSVNHSINSLLFAGRQGRNPFHPQGWLYFISFCQDITQQHICSYTKRICKTNQRSQRGIFSPRSIIPI